jgi:hypothetical protein
MRKIILTHGLIAGIIVGVPMLIGNLAFDSQPPVAIAMTIGYATMLIALSTVFLGIKRQRDTAGGGVIRFWPALGMGLGITVIAALIYVATWELTQALSGYPFVADYTRMLVAEKQAAGASAAEIATLRAQMDQFAVQYADPLYRLPVTFIEIFPVGVLVSVISAALLRNPRFLPARA